jgi:hypothetical protein
VDFGRIYGLHEWYFFDKLIVDDFVKSRNQTAKKKDPDARRANPEE